MTRPWRRKLRRPGSRSSEKKNAISIRPSQADVPHEPGPDGRITVTVPRAFINRKFGRMFEFLVGAVEADDGFEKEIKLFVRR